MASQISSSAMSLSPAPKSAGVTTNNMLQQLKQLQRITQQMPVFMAPSKTTALSANSKIITDISAPKSATNNLLQQLQQLQNISQQIAPSKTTSLSASSNIFSTCSATKSELPTTNKVHQQPQHLQKQQGPRLSYVIYLHLEERKRSKATKLSKANAKYQLTHELISKTMRSVHKLSPDEMEIISQQTIYKKNLEREIATENHKKYMKNYRKQQKPNFPKKKQQTQSSPQQYQHHQPHGSVVAPPMEGIPSPGFFSRRT